MQELPGDLLTTDKLLYLQGLDGESQVALMKELAKIAQKLYDEFPEFCALVPFGSRTKGLSQEEESDIDIIIVLDYKNTLNKDELRKKIEEFSSKKGIKCKLSIQFVDLEEYKHPNPEKYGSFNFVMYGPKIWPNRLKEQRPEIINRTKERIADHLIRSLHLSEKLWATKKNITNKDEFVKNRMRLWERRIRSLLNLKEQKKD